MPLVCFGVVGCRCMWGDRSAQKEAESGLVCGWHLQQLLQELGVSFCSYGCLLGGWSSNCCMAQFPGGLKVAHFLP